MKKIYCLTILSFVLFQFGCGQNPKTDTKKEANTTIDSLAPHNLDSAIRIPQPIGWTNDFAKLFSKEEIKSLDSLIAIYDKKGIVQFSIATIDSSMLGTAALEAYSLRMLNTWGVGQKGKNNGILILIIPDLRRIRIENGYGIENVLTDKETKIIIDSTITPYFKTGNFYQGTREGMLAIISKLEHL